MACNPTCVGPCFERPRFEKECSIPSVRNLTLSAVTGLALGELAKCTSNKRHGRGLQGTMSQHVRPTAQGIAENSRRHRAPGAPWGRHGASMGPHGGPHGLPLVPLGSPGLPPQMPPLPWTVFEILAVRNKYVKRRQNASKGSVTVWFTTKQNRQKASKGDKLR